MPGHLPSSGRARRAADRARLGARPALARPETAALSRLRTTTGRARHPRPQEASTSLQKGLALAREESVVVLARAVVARRETRPAPTPLPRGEWRGRGGG